MRPSITIRRVGRGSSPFPTDSPSIICAHPTDGDGWVKTSVHVYAELLKRREPKRWHRYQEELRGHEPFDALGGPQYDGSADDVESYDVFFDEEDEAACSCVAGGGSAKGFERKA